MVAMEVCNAHGRRPRDCHASERALASCSLAGVEQDQLVVPAQRVAVVGSVPGWKLACGAQNHQFAYAHGDAP